MTKFTDLDPQTYKEYQDEHETNRTSISLKTLRIIFKLLSLKTSSDIQAVIKANAYGLDLEEVVECIENDVESFAVITLNEAISLRKHAKNQ